MLFASNTFCESHERRSTARNLGSSVQMSPPGPIPGDLNGRTRGSDGSIGAAEQLRVRTCGSRFLSNESPPLRALPRTAKQPADSSGTSARERERERKREREGGERQLKCRELLLLRWAVEILHGGDARTQTCMPLAPAKKRRNRITKRARALYRSCCCCRSNLFRQRSLSSPNRRVFNSSMKAAKRW